MLLGALKTRGESQAATLRGEVLGFFNLEIAEGSFTQVRQALQQLMSQVGVITCQHRSLLSRIGCGESETIRVLEDRLEGLQRQVRDSRAYSPEGKAILRSIPLEVADLAHRLSGAVTRGYCAVISDAEKKFAEEGSIDPVLLPDNLRELDRPAEMK